jgi:cell wall-associated NlpC family hydrolase
MKKLFYLYLLSTITALNSCTALRNATAKDNSASSAQQQNKNSGNSVFLDNINVTPGSQKTFSSESAASTKTYGTATNTTNVTTDANYSSIQLKYSPILDVPADQLVNTKLLLDIDYWWGTKYCMGGSDENCIDCSAFTQNLMRDVYAVNLPRTAQEQYENTKRVKKNDLKEGDLVFFQTMHRGISHVGVYVANNKFVHASVSNGVIISDLGDEYWKKRYRGAGRVLQPTFKGE